MEKVESEVTNTDKLVDTINHHYFDLVERQQVLASVNTFFDEVNTYFTVDYFSDHFLLLKVYSFL